MYDLILKLRKIGIDENVLRELRLRLKQYQALKEKRLNRPMSKSMKQIMGEIRDRHKFLKGYLNCLYDMGIITYEDLGRYDEVLLGEPSEII